MYNIYFFFWLNIDTNNTTDTVNVQPSPQRNNETNQGNAIDDDDVCVFQRCTQALQSGGDDVETENITLSAGEPQSKIPKIDAQPPLDRPKKPLLMSRLALKPLNQRRFTFVTPKTSTTNVTNLPQSSHTTNSNKENAVVEPSNTLPTVDKSKRNRIFFTPSDEESSQNSQQQAQVQQKAVKKFPFKLNLGTFKTSSQRSISQQQQVNEMNTSSNPLGSAAETGKIPPIWPPSTGTQQSIADQDLSCLDSLEF